MSEQTQPKNMAGNNPGLPPEDGPARRRAVRRRNIAVGLGLLALCLIIYLVSFVRIGGAG